MSDKEDLNHAESNEEPQNIKEVELSGHEARTKLAELMGDMSMNSVVQTSVKSQQDYKFWSTQPVPSMNSQSELESLDDHGQPIEVKALTDVQQTPYSLISTFEWSEVDVSDDAQLEEAYRLLNENYVEDDEAMFRFDYSRDFLRWALLPPGWKKSWHVGVRVKKNKKLVALITAVPASVTVQKSTLPMVEINFLCIHKKLRAKRLAPVLIREITRRVNLENIWQAVYTAGALLPRPVTSSRYYHRSLNPKKLIEVGFSRLQPRMTMARTIKLYSMKPIITVPGIREFREEDVSAVCELLRQHSSRFDLHVNASEQEVAHWLLPRKNVVYTYVVEDPESGVVTDMVSFYSLPSSIMKHPTHKALNAAYYYCTVALKTSIVDLMKDALVFAIRNGFDVFNALDLGDNSQFLKELKFHLGDGELHYYLYNWKCRPIDQRKNSLVLL